MADRIHAGTRQIANFVFMACAEAIDDGDHDRIEALFGDATFVNSQIASHASGWRGVPPHDRAPAVVSLRRLAHGPCTSCTNLQIDIDDETADRHGRGRSHT